MSDKKTTTNLTIYMIGNINYRSINRNTYGYHYGRQIIRLLAEHSCTFNSECEKNRNDQNDIIGYTIEHWFNGVVCTC